MKKLTITLLLLLQLITPSAHADVRDDIVDIGLKIYEMHGMDGLQEFSEECYRTQGYVEECLYIDIFGSKLDTMMSESMGFPLRAYFDNEMHERAYLFFQNNNVTDLNDINAYLDKHVTYIENTISNKIVN